MIEKYFSRRFKTLIGVRVAIFLKDKYDWFRLTRNGEKILSQRYRMERFNPNDGYRIVNLIWTANMVADIKELSDINKVLKSGAR